MARKYPRWRTLQHIRQQARSQYDLLRNSTDSSAQAFYAKFTAESPVIQNSSPQLGADPTEFTSYHAPSLPAGEYSVTATQSVADPESGAVVNLISKQPFHVHGPRFNLQPDIIHQVYPPTGTSEHNNILPHIVFEDPHLPWEQKVIPDKAEHQSHDPVSERKARNRVPWLALLVFEESELKLDPENAKPVGQGGLLPNPQQGMPDDSVQQNSVTFAVKTTVGSLIDLENQSAAAGRQLQLPLRKEDIKDDELGQPIDLIYVRQRQIDNLFCSSAPDGSRIDVEQNRMPDLSRYSYLSHVRKNASVVHSADNDEHYSIVIAHQTGPIKNPEPKTLIVHLVSLEGVYKHIKLNPTADAEQIGLVGLISLYSWSFTSLPPDKVNLIASLKKIGADLQDTPDAKGDCWLRAPRSKIEALRGNMKANPVIAEKLAQRLEDGFMLQRYLPQTGEETVSFFRGPLTPTYVKPIAEEWWPMQSNFATDYQVLDPNLGIMDVSYSAAWQLGRVLGLANQQFAAALVRLRSSISIDAKATAESRYKGVNTNVTNVMSSLANGVSQMNMLAQNPDVQLNGVGGRRGTVIGSYKPGVDVQPAGDFTNSRQDYEVAEQIEREEKRKVYVAQLGQNVDKISAAVDSKTGALHNTDNADYLPYNELNIPASTDWQIVQEFVLRKMNLYDIPAHYLITDASNLQNESLKYFYIDSNWIDALLDGMLSIGNHLENKDDVVKQAIKKNLNRYFATPYGLPEVDYRPQVPCFGFFLRSAIVKAFPGLEVSAPFPSTSEKRQQAILVEQVDEDVLLCLFDRMPGSKYWHPSDGISISAPPHQPCFRLGNTLTYDNDGKGRLELQLRPLYTTKDKLPYEEQDRTVSATDPEHRWRSLKPLTYTNVNGVDGHDDAAVLTRRIFDFENRMLVVPAYGSMCLEFLKREVNKDREKEYFKDDEPTAVLVGLQLNASIPALVINTPRASNLWDPLDTIETVRQIRLPSTSLSSFESTALTEAPALQVETDSLQPQSLAVTLPKTYQRTLTAQNTNTNAITAEDGKRSYETGNEYIDSLTDIIEYHLRQRREAGALSRPYLTPPKPLRSSYFTKLVGWIDDAVTEAKGGEVPIGDYIPAQYTANVHMDNEDDVKRASDDQIPPVDLIFSIGFRDFTGKWEKLSDKRWDKPDLQLFSLQIDIPLGAGAKKIAEVYNGPGAKMINNQLFTIHLEDIATEERDEDDHFVRFTLVPRTITRSIPLSKCSDMSFIVNQIVPNVKKGRCVFHITENYRSRWMRSDAGKDAAAAPPASAVAAHAGQPVLWRQHQAAHSTDFEWGMGWVDFFGSISLGGVAIAFGFLLAAAYLLLASVGVPLLYVIFKVLMIVVSFTSKAATWTYLQLMWTAYRIWEATPYVLGGSAVILTMVGIILFKTTETPSGLLILWILIMEIIPLFIAAGLVYVGIGLVSFILPLIPGTVIWWYLAFLILLAFSLWRINNRGDVLDKLFVVLLFRFAWLPIMILTVAGYFLLRLLIVIWDRGLPIVWNYLSTVSHWLSAYWIPIVTVSIAAYVTVWYRTSDRGVFYVMALLALGTVVATLSGSFTVWIWHLLFGK